MSKATIEGLNYLLAAGMKNGSRSSAFYLGLLVGDFTESSAITAATLFSSATEGTGYDGLTRKAVTLGDPSGGILLGGDVTFSFTEAITVTGTFLCTAPDKSGAAGVLMGIHKFTDAKTYKSGDELVVVPQYKLLA